MADFDPPFAHSGELRLPSANERDLGFSCGPADRPLFNAMFNRIEAELGDLISYAGIVPSDTVNTKVREAVLALINAATGGGVTTDYVLMSQAKARLPIFPEVNTADGTFGIITPATGQIRVPAGINFLHRGIFLVTTAQLDFPTTASKTYHLRWYPSGVGRAIPAATYPNGLFYLEDLLDTNYNPASVGEANVMFDSKYDGMLVARVIANSSNVPTITNLVNLNRLFSTFSVSGPSSPMSANWDSTFLGTSYLNWARTPKTSACIGGHYIGGASAGMECGPIIQKQIVNRYQVTAAVQSNWVESGYYSGQPVGYMHIECAA
jgi:hypothetical protein